MSDLLIKGMKMPKDKPLIIKINPDGAVSSTFDNDYRKYEAFSIPPHGNLIDRDALMKGDGRYIISFGKEGIDVAEISRAPTIISATEEG